MTEKMRRRDEKNKQSNPNWSKFGGLYVKVDNWSLISASLELNVIFEDFYAIKDH